nr:ribonuclease H-like domain-containing protein [Tanacetum cinerariifolium]
RYVRGTVNFGLQLYASATTSLVGAEAEYRGVANVVAEITWLRNLLRELHSPLSTATLLYCDNVSAVYLSANPVQHQRTKHNEINIHFVRDMVQTGHIRVLHVPSRYHYADILTKGLPTALFEDFRSSLSVRLPPAQTAGVIVDIFSSTMASPISGCHPITFKPLSTLLGRTLKPEFVVATSSYARST